jgi:cytochrome c peroxidase
MREKLPACFSTFTLTVSVSFGAVAAAACDSLEDPLDGRPSDALREGEEDVPAEPPDPADPPASIPGSLADEDLPPIFDINKSNEPIEPGIIKSREKAIMLGKALFWDMQAGSDGQACASCHFSAGADPRARNQLSPGLLGGDDDFDDTRSGKNGGPNYMLVAADFPFHVKKDPKDRRSKVLFDTNDVTSSQGVLRSEFEAVKPGELEDICEPEHDSDFEVDDINVRRVEPRNTPTTVNAGFNFRNFWDGRANRFFNGVDPFGPRNKDAFVLEAKPDGEVVKRELLLINSSLASQAVGPLLNDFEMSCAGRSFQNVGHKLLRSPTKPLAFQKVHHDDSVLGYLANNKNGLNTTYQKLIKDAFDEKFWDSDEWFDADKKRISNPNKVSSSKRFTLMESNFSLFWGLAIQEYERSLVSANSPFDRYQDGESNALGYEELEGLDVFMNQGKCVNCHGTAMFTNASTLHLIPEDEEGGLVERMLMSEEHFHYQVKTDSSLPLYKGAMGLKTQKKDTYDVDLDVEGTPTLSGAGIVPGSAQGTIELKNQATKATCKYSATSLTFGADNTNSRDARIMASLAAGAGCPQTLRISVVDDMFIGGNTWFDYIHIDDGGTGFIYSGFGKSNDVEIRQPALYDSGFYNIGVRPTKDDIGVGGKDPFGNPLSFTQQFVKELLGKPVVDIFDVDPCTFVVPWLVGLDGVLFPGGFKDQTDCDGTLSFLTGLPAKNAANERFIKDLRVAVDGAFKTPTLRNVQLTAPYMHNGGMSTLEQVVEFYNRGGNFPNNKALDPDITPLNLSDEQRKNLVLFLEALTDPDVVYERAPFDHPQLFVPNGLKKVKDSDPKDGHADEDLFKDGLEIPAVGKDGRYEPIDTFLGLEDDDLM